MQNLPGEIVTYVQIYFLDGGGGLIHVASSISSINIHPLCLNLASYENFKLLQDMEGEST